MTFSAGDLDGHDDLITERIVEVAAPAEEPAAEEVAPEPEPVAEEAAPAAAEEDEMPDLSEI